uniref:Uncharacterized protein n=1 Tax=Arundo donax TaxID=35708 RepID=A0A0A9GK80_ARUDO
MNSLSTVLLKCYFFTYMFILRYNTGRKSYVCFVRLALYTVDQHNQTGIDITYTC